MGYLWLKSLHVIFMVTWFAGLFYLPRLFVYHAQQQPQAVTDLFVVMERRLFGIMTLGASLTALFGTWMLIAYFPIYASSGWQLVHGWLIVKLIFITLLLIYHGYCYSLMRDFAQDRNRHSERWYRIFNELPAVALIMIVIMVIVRPI